MTLGVRVLQFLMNDEVMDEDLRVQCFLYSDIETGILQIRLTFYSISFKWIKMS